MKYIIIIAVIGAVAFNVLGSFVDLSFVTQSLPTLPELPTLPTWLTDIIG